MSNWLIDEMFKIIQIKFTEFEPELQKALINQLESLIESLIEIIGEKIGIENGEADN